MTQEEIPTAEEFLIKGKYKDSFGNLLMYSSEAQIAMIEFAKLHVKAALKTTSEKATVTPIDHEEISEGSFRPIWGVDDDSILTAYPLTNIK